MSFFRYFATFQSARKFFTREISARPLQLLPRQQLNLRNKIEISEKFRLCPASSTHVPPPNFVIQFVESTNRPVGFKSSFSKTMSLNGHGRRRRRVVCARVPSLVYKPISLSLSRSGSLLLYIVSPLHSSQRWMLTTGLYALVLHLVHIRAHIHARTCSLPLLRKRFLSPWL